MATSLDAFFAPVRSWFLETLGAPTPPQEQGWLPIQRGEHTLILAPTGSGKTLAAFLWGIDQLFRENQEQTTGGDGIAPEPGQQPPRAGVRLLYISPLKALNNDIERNLRVPLEGIREQATRQGVALPELRVAVRTGDTPSHARAAMWKKPPHILITTPESLYLMLTSPRAREMFRTVRTVIVDEIHTLCGNKRGVHLSLSLERLEHLTATPVQRIGLSATIKPLEEVARFLGGPHPVTIVNATYHKPLDLRIVGVVEDFRNLPGHTIWPYVIPRVLQDIREHRSTLVYANNRRLAERTADRLNAQLAAEQSEEIEPGSSQALAPGGVPRDRGMFAIGAEGPIQAHHGSMSKEARLKMEQDLKAGKLPALVGTSSLELGIDIGSVDLVVQLQSPKSVAQGLQRVGRAGHVVGETSVGRIYPTFREDLVEAAAIVRGMLDGDVEPTYTPVNPLDVLAQQIVAMVSVDEWPVAALYDLVCRAYAYRSLSRAAFDGVLAMLSGKYPTIRARVAWDQVNGRLAALPGSRLLAMTNAGTISDTGAYHVYLEDHKTKVGELDEEFVFETRVGDTFLLGSKVWRVLGIETDRVVVGDAGGAVPRMPFWHGDYPWRPYELGLRIGQFRREIVDKARAFREAGAAPSPEMLRWLQDEFALDDTSARNLLLHVQQQIDAVGVMASDTTIIVESFEDAVGEPRLVIHSPFGGRVNGAWALALASAIRERTGIAPETQTNDDGILFRFPAGSGEFPVDLIRQMTPAEAHERIVKTLPGSAVFGAHFRMNAARALLLPKSRGQKRTPFWLQRLKAKDLLASLGRYDDFPIVAETYRDCLRDVLDLPHLEEVLAKIASGAIDVVAIETAIPSPVASALLFQFVNVYMYEWDTPKAERALQALTISRELLDDLLASDQLQHLLKPEAVDEITARRQHLAPGYQARTVEELAVVLQELGDLTADEIVARCAGDSHTWIAELAARKRIAEISIPSHRGRESRWVPAELAAQYESLGEPSAASEILTRFLRSSGPVTRQGLLNRYAFPEEWLDKELSRLSDTREIGRGHVTPLAASTAEEFVDRRSLEQIHQRTLSLLRKEVQPVSLYAYADFLTRWQHVTPGERVAGDDAMRRVLQQLQGIALPLAVWEMDTLPSRLAERTTGETTPAGELDALCASGDLVWVAQGNRLRLFSRGQGALFLPPAPETLSVPQVDDKGLEPAGRGSPGAESGATTLPLSANAMAVYDYMRSEGASFAADLEAALKFKSDVVGAALGELAAAGWITNDSWGTLNEARSGRPASAVSPLEAELSARMISPRSLTPSRYRDAKRRVTQRLRAEPRPAARAGRWSLVYRPRVLGPAMSLAERAASLAAVLLARYGVLTRETLEHEQELVDWALLYPELERMEMRGQVRRGYFVAGLPGVQFALPEAVEKLRAAAASPQDSPVVLNATDPANVFGPERTEVPIRFARLSSTWVVLDRGRPVLVAEDGGNRITSDPGVERDAVERALPAFLDRPNAPRHVAVTQWNGAGVLGSAFESLLRAHGFRRTPAGMER